MDELSHQEELIDQYVKENNKEAAVKLLFDLIVSYAKKKNFEKAETLREKLFEVDSMALNEIIKSGDIIEEEKTESWLAGSWPLSAGQISAFPREKV